MRPFGFQWMGWVLSLGLATFAYSQPDPCPTDLGLVGKALYSHQHVRERLFPLFQTTPQSIPHPQASEIGKRGTLPTGVARVVRTFATPADFSPNGTTFVSPFRWRVVIEHDKLVVFKHPAQDTLFAKDGEVHQIMSFAAGTSLHPHAISEVRQLSHYPRSPYALAIASQSEVMLLNVLTGDVIQTFITQNPIRAVALHPDYLFAITTHHIELFSFASQKTQHVVYEAKDRVQWIPPISTLASGTHHHRPLLIMGSDQQTYAFSVSPKTGRLEQLFTQVHSDPVKDLALLSEAETQQPQATLVVRTQNKTHATLETYALVNGESPLKPHLQQSHRLPSRHQFPILTYLNFSVPSQTRQGTLLIADPLFQQGICLPLGEGANQPIPFNDLSSIFELTPLHDMTNAQ